MNLTYQRKLYRQDGIFSDVLDADGNHVFVVLEHAYPQTDGSFLPILQPGTYDCIRGAHRLHGMTENFITFEIVGVNDAQGLPHHGILLHWGNYNRDSEGCSLVGESIVNDGKQDMVTNSRSTFAKFMEMQKDVDTFKLTVIA